MSEDEINALLDWFIDKYFAVMGKHSERAKVKALAAIKEYLEAAQVSDFADAQGFAEALFKIIQTAFNTVFDDKSTAAAIKQVTKEIYSFYRLRDETAFGSYAATTAVKFGAVDKAAVAFIDSLDHWYFSKFIDNKNTGLREFLKAQYFEKGAGLFGRETPESLDDFRQAAGKKLANVSDRQIKAIVTTSVQRIRNYTDVIKLHEDAAFDLAVYVAIFDAKTTKICERIDGVRLRVPVAYDRIKELIKLEPGDFAEQVYESTAAREYQKDPVTWIEKHITDGVIDDDALRQNIGIPPLHINCRTRLEGVFDELDGSRP